MVDYVVKELEAMAARGGLSLTNISLKEGMAKLSCTYAGADHAKMHAWLSAQAESVNASPPNTVVVQPIAEGSFTFTVSLPKSSCKNLLVAIKQQALELAARIEAEKKARRGRKKKEKTQ